MCDSLTPSNNAISFVLVVPHARRRAEEGDDEEGDEEEEGEEATDNYLDPRFYHSVLSVSAEKEWSREETSLIKPEGLEVIDDVHPFEVTRSKSKYDRTSDWWASLISFSLADYYHIARGVRDKRFSRNHR